MNAGDAEELRRAQSRTIASGTARIVYANDNIWTLPTFPRSEPPGPLRRALAGLGKVVAKPVADRFRHQTAEGVIDFSAARWMLDYGGFATMQVGDHQWGGRAGRAISTLPEMTVEVGSPLWLIDLLAGVTGAERTGLDQTEHGRWQRLVATASLAQAASRNSRAMPSPARRRFEDLDELSIEAWLDDDDTPLVRQIRFLDQYQIRTMTLTEFGPVIDDLDWSRLPTFRSPKEASR